MSEDFHGCRGRRGMKTQTKRNIVRSNTPLRSKVLVPTQNGSCEFGGMLEGHFSGQGQHVVKVALMLEYHFSWQEQYFVTWDSCLVVNARHAAFFHATCVSQAQKVNSANKRFADWQIHGGTMVGSRITLGSWSDRLEWTFSVLSWCQAEYLVVTFCGRGTIWWNCNDVGIFLRVWCNIWRSCILCYRGTRNIWQTLG